MVVDRGIPIHDFAAVTDRGYNAEMKLRHDPMAASAILGPSYGMQAYRNLRAGVTLFFIAYFGGGLATELVPGGREVFPVFSWFLFTKTPNVRAQYGLLVREAGGRELNPPRLYEEADGFVSAPRAIAAQTLFQEIGAALKQGNESEVRRLRRLLEATYLPLPARYDLVWVRYDPMVRWKTGAFEITPVRAFPGGEEKP